MALRRIGVRERSAAPGRVAARGGFGIRPGALLSGALLLAGCSAPEEAPAGPASRILLVTLDTTRADRLGAYGYAKAHTPTIDALAREGVLFERAHAATPITLPSHASILTGVYPPAHGVRLPETRVDAAGLLKLA